LNGCYEHCSSLPSAGYFAYKAQGKGCSCYLTSEKCPDDEAYSEYAAYQILVKATSYEFEHDGHCNGGYIQGSHTYGHQSLNGCYEHCSSLPSAGYFAYKAQGKGCSCYLTSDECPDDNAYPEYNAYRILGQCDAIETDTNILGNDLNAGGFVGRVIGNLPNVEACRKACVDLEECAAFTFVKSELTNDNCAVKTSSWVSSTKETGNTCCDSGPVTDSCRKFYQGMWLTTAIMDNNKPSFRILKKSAKPFLKKSFL